MEKLRKSILGLILGVFLTFGSLMIFSKKVNAAANIVSVDEIPLNAPVEFNSSIDFSMLNGKEVRIANSTDSLGTSIASVYGVDMSRIQIDGTNSVIRYTRSNGAVDTVYQNGSWTYNYQRFLQTSATNQWCGYYFDALDNQWGRDDADAELIAFINTNMTITQPIVYFNVTINANGGEFISRFHDEDPILYPNYLTMTFSTNQGNVYFDLMECLIDTNTGQYSAVKSGYTFIGWNTNSLATTVLSESQINNISAATTLYAIYTSQTYTISFNSNGADSGTVPASQSVAAGYSFTLPANTGNLTKSGYTFIGWNTSSSSTTALTTYTVNSNTIFYAVWRSEAPPTQYYTVSFNGNGADSGTVPASQSVAAGSSFTLPANTGNLTKSGYNFVGWSKHAISQDQVYGVGDEVIIDANTTFYAVWQEVQVIPRHMTLKVLVNNEIVYESFMIKEIGNSYDWGLKLDDSLPSELNFFNINYLQPISINSELLLMNYAYNLVFTFNSDAINNIAIRVNGELVDEGSLSDWKEYFTEHTYMNMPFYENAELTISYTIDSSSVSWLNTFLSIVRNITSGLQALLDLRFGWISIGGIVGIILTFAVAFFIFKLVSAFNSAGGS